MKDGGGQKAGAKRTRRTGWIVEGEIEPARDVDLNYMESASGKQSLKYSKPKQKTLGSESPTCVQRERVLFVWSCI